MNFYFICYDKFTEKVFLKLNLEYLSNSELLEQKGFKIEIDRDNEKNNFCFIFWKNSSIRKFWKIKQKYEKIQKNYIRVF